MSADAETPAPLGGETTRPDNDGPDRPGLLLTIPDFALVVLIGVSGSGKSTFAGSRFLPTEVLSSDAFRALVSDDENDQGATAEAFDALHYVAAIRLRLPQGGN